MKKVWMLAAVLLLSLVLCAGCSGKDETAKADQRGSVSSVQQEEAQDDVLEEDEIKTENVTISTDGESEYEEAELEWDE